MLVSKKAVVFLIAVVCCLAQMVLAAKQIVNFKGPNEVCHKGRICAKNAACVHGKCYCLTGYSGNGYFCCNSDDDKDYYCSVTGDPHLWTFPDGEGEIDIPCRHRLSKFYADDTIYDGFCSFEVFGTIEVVDQGVYYEGQTEVYLVVTDEEEEEFTLEVTFGADGGRYKSGVQAQAVPFDSEIDTTVVLGKVEVSLRFDNMEKFFILEVKACHTSIKWRPRDPNPDLIRRQIRRPGIGISVRDPYFPDLRYGVYRPDLCLTSEEEKDIFKIEAEYYDLVSPNLPILKRILANKDVHVNDRGVFADQCSKAQDLFADCSKERRTRALNVCGSLLSNRPLIDCQLEKSLDFMDAFKDCLDGHCNVNAARCEAAEAIFNQCEPTDLSCDNLT